MSNLEVLQEILHEGYKHPNQDVIEETNIDCRGKKFAQKYKIEQGDTSVGYLLYRYDHNAFPFFKDVTGLKKMCDYILFTEWNNRLKVFAIELKQSNVRASPQLEAACEFANYIVRSSNRIGHTIDLSFSVWKIRICDSKVKKPKINVSSRIKFDDKHYCDYQLSTLRIDQLVKSAK